MNPEQYSSSPQQENVSDPLIEDQYGRDSMGHMILPVINQIPVLL